MSMPVKFMMSGLLVVLAITGLVLGAARLRADLVTPWADGYVADGHYMQGPLVWLSIWALLLLVCAVLPLVRRPSIDPVMGLGMGALLVVFVIVWFPTLASNVTHVPVGDARRVTNSVAEAIAVLAKQSGHWPTAREVEASAGVDRMPTPWILHGIPLLYQVTVDKRDVGSFAVPPQPGIIACVTDDSAGEIECRFSLPESSDRIRRQPGMGVLVARKSIKDKH